MIVEMIQIRKSQAFGETRTHTTLPTWLDSVLVTVAMDFVSLVQSAERAQWFR